MAGYLENYRSGEERREKIVRNWILSVLSALILSTVLYFAFRNYREERQIKAFLESLEKRDYQGAYAYWGCSAQKPCRDYDFNHFLEDWGPKSPHTDIVSAKLEKTKSCPTGIIQIVDFAGGNNVNLWVDRKTRIIGFAPWTVCNPRMAR